MPTKQETYDRVCKHLYNQKKQSIGKDGDCAYRGENGLQCAGGCLIPDDKYAPEMEGMGVPTIEDSNRGLKDPAHKKLEQVLISEGHDLDLVADLQDNHDTYPPENWPEKLEETARLHNLVYRSPEDMGVYDFPELPKWGE